MTLEGLEHIGIAVSDLEEALAFYEEAFGLKAESIVTLEERNVRVAFLPLGNTKIELLEPLALALAKHFDFRVAARRDIVGGVHKMVCFVEIREDRLYLCGIRDIRNCGAGRRVLRDKILDVGRRGVAYVYVVAVSEECPGNRAPDPGRATPG